MSINTINKEKSIERLNSLIELDNESLESYGIDETGLKVKPTSKYFKKELIDEMYDMGDEPTKERTSTNNFFDFLSKLKTMLSGNCRKAILNVCLHSEEEIINTYRKALKDNLANISTYQRIMINAQQRLLRVDYARIIALNNKSDKY